MKIIDGINNPETGIDLLCASTGDHCCSVMSRHSGMTLETQRCILEWLCSTTLEFVLNDALCTGFVHTNEKSTDFYREDGRFP